MKTTIVEINETNYVAHYEFTEAEEQDREYPGTQPMVRLWTVETEDGENITSSLSSLEWVDVENQIYNKLEL